MTDHDHPISFERTIEATPEKAFAFDQAATNGDAGLDPWASGGDEIDHLSAAEASWAMCQQVLLNLTATDQDRPTPCSEFTVHELVEHLVGSLRSLGGMAGAEIPDDIRAASAEDYVAQAAELALGAWRERGVDGNVQFFSREAPAVLPAGILSLEFFIHAWDLAQASDQAFEPAEPLTTFVTGLAQQIIQPKHRGEGQGFAASVPHGDDDPVTSLMAFTGREV